MLVISPLSSPASTIVWLLLRVLLLCRADLGEAGRRGDDLSGSVGPWASLLGLWSGTSSEMAFTVGWNALVGGFLDFGPFGRERVS